MFGYLVLLFTVVPAIELVLLIEVGSRIGSVNTISLIVLTGVVGAYLARLQGFLVVRRIQENLNAGRMPTAEMLDGLMIFCGGVLLLTPGFLTDALGFFLLIPLTRDLIKIWAKRKITRMIDEGQIVTSHSSLDRKSDDDDQDFEDAEFH